MSPPSPHEAEPDAAAGEEPVEVQPGDVRSQVAAARTRSRAKGPPKVTVETEITLKSYMDLMRDLLAQTIDEQGFKRAYIKLFLNDGTMWPERELRVLEQVFVDADDFCVDILAWEPKRLFRGE